MALSRWIWTKQLYYIIWPLANVSNTTQSTPKQIKMCKITIFILLFKKIAIPETSENDDKVRTIIRLILETGVDINAKTFPQARAACIWLVRFPPFSRFLNVLLLTQWSYIALSGNKLLLEGFVEFGADITALTSKYPTSLPPLVFILHLLTRFIFLPSPPLSLLCYQ